MTMRVRTFHDPAAFRAAADPLLLAQEALNCLVIGLAATLDAGQDGTFLGVVEDGGGTPVLAALRTPPRFLVLSAAVGDPRAAAEALAAHWAASGSPLPGVSGPRVEAAAFSAAWTARRGGTSRREMAERVYELEAVTWPAPVDGGMRAVGPDDLPLMRDWAIAFAREALPEERDPEAAGTELVARRCPEVLGVHGLRLWENGAGHPVALAGYAGPTPHGIRVGPVYTPVAQRRRGYASALVASLSQALLEAGKARVYLFTDLANPTANALYQRIGYRAVGDFDMVALP
jgi:GNAT superfamily N-acetyltransferase